MEPIQILSTVLITLGITLVIYFISLSPIEGFPNIINFFAFLLDITPLEVVIIETPIPFKTLSILSDGIYLLHPGLLTLSKPWITGFPSLSYLKNNLRTFCLLSSILI